MRWSFLPLLAMTVVVAGCQAGPSANTYQHNQTQQTSTVVYGQIASVRTVQVAGTQSGVGVGAGAVAGGVAGSFIGGGWRSNALGAVGGAVLGGLAGSAAEEAVTKGESVEFIVNLDDGSMVSVVQNNEDNLVPGDRVVVLQGEQSRIIRDTSGR